MHTTAALPPSCNVVASLTCLSVQRLFCAWGWGNGSLPDLTIMLVLQVSYMTNNKLWSDEEAEHGGQKFAPPALLGPVSSAA